MQEFKQEVENMDEKIRKTYFRNILNTRLKILKTMENTNSDSRNTVNLDQSSVGRLSRMDAMQQQAMANATAQNRIYETKAIHAALMRLETGEYGYCDVCGDQIAIKRLELTPTATCCVSCPS